MNRKSIVTVMGSLLLVAALLPSIPASATPLHRYLFNFENGLKPWTAQADGVAQVSLARVAGADACNQLSPMGHFARLSSGASMVVLPPEIARTWMLVALPTDDQQVGVEVEWNARHRANVMDENYNSYLSIAYVGATAPASYQFTTLKALRSAWTSYDYRTTVMDAQGTVYVAIGWDGVDGNMDADCVTITIVPILDGKTNP